MVRISIPTLPTLAQPYISPHQHLDLPQAASYVKNFLQKGNGKTLVVTGAGVSVDSGIKAYRGHDGRYNNPNFKPVYYHELIDPTEKGTDFRKRYWSRGYLGWTPVQRSEPNPIHYAVAAMVWMKLARQVITQNVDGLHQKAFPYSKKDTLTKVLDLHGTLHLVHCKNGHTVSREAYQERLSELNPSWKAFAEEAERTGTMPATNPDGDVDLQGKSYDGFVVPRCTQCEEIMKPNVVFFGESISNEVKDRSSKAVTDSSQLLVMGTSLATYSAFRLIKQARDENKPVLLLSLGPSRADGMEGVDKIEMEAGPVLNLALRGLSSGMENDETLARLLTSGTVKKIEDHKDP